MFNLRRQTTPIFLALAVLFSILLAPLPIIRAADHAESTTVADDPGADLADVFAFLDPLDNTKVVLALDVSGFIVPSEFLNLGYFPSGVLYRFEIENTGDAAPDRRIDIQFSEQTSRTSPQTASIYLNGIENGVSFTAPTTVPTQNATPPPFVITTNAQNNAKFFAGLTDDPFYFDIVAFNRFTSSVTSGNPNPAVLQRARDSFAGYSIHMIVIELPAASLTGPAGSKIGVNGVTLRQKAQIKTTPRGPLAVGPYVQVDRMATPALNTVLMPFSRKNEYNAATTVDDANGRFANSIIASLQALGTNQQNISILAAVAVTNGDFLRLDTAQPNTSLGFGERATTVGYNGFPNGRRPGDDTVDVISYYVTNQALTMIDNVNSNDVPIPVAFPFFAPPQQPRDSGVDDNTRN
jgi:hypothetical protein